MLVLDSQGKYEEALLKHREELARLEKVIGPEHLDTLTSMENLALMLDRKCKYLPRETLAKNL
jgi:hypothetical protein